MNRIYEGLDFGTKKLLLLPVFGEMCKFKIKLNT